MVRGSFYWFVLNYNANPINKYVFVPGVDPLSPQ